LFLTQVLEALTHFFPAGITLFGRHILELFAALLPDFPLLFHDLAALFAHCRPFFLGQTGNFLPALPDFATSFLDPLSRLLTSLGDFFLAEIAIPFTPLLEAATALVPEFLAPGLIVGSLLFRGIVLGHGHHGQCAAKTENRQQGCRPCNTFHSSPPELIHRPW
jgi:hypothetical protein